MGEVQWYYIYGKNERRCEILLQDMIEKYKIKNDMWDIPEEEIVYDIRNEYYKKRKIRYNKQPILIYKRLEEMKGNSIEIEIDTLIKTKYPQIVILMSYNSPTYYKWTHELIDRHIFKICDVDEKLLIVN